METTDERPHLQRGLPGRGVSPIGWLRTGLAKGNQVHIPLHRPQKRQRRSAGLLPGSGGASSPTVEPGRESHPKRVHPARQAHQPLGPGTASRPPSGNRERRGQARAESTSVSRRSQHSNRPHVARRASTLTTTDLQGGSAQLAAGRLARARLDEESRARAPLRPPLAHDQPHTPQSVAPE